MNYEKIIIIKITVIIDKNAKVNLVKLILEIPILIIHYKFTIEIMYNYIFKYKNLKAISKCNKEFMIFKTNMTLCIIPT